MPKITIEHEITEAFLRDVLTTAVESGHGSLWYWEGFEMVDVMRDPESQYHEVIRVSFKADVGEPTRNVYSVGTLLMANAIQDLLNGKVEVNNTILGYIRDGVADNDAGCIDATAADVIVQVAAFGKVAFG